MLTNNNFEYWESIWTPNYKPWSITWEGITLIKIFTLCHHKDPCKCLVFNLYQPIPMKLLTWIEELLPGDSKPIDILLLMINIRRNYHKKLFMIFWPSKHTSSKNGQSICNLQPKISQWLLKNIEPSIMPPSNSGFLAMFLATKWTPLIGKSLHMMIVGRTT